MLRFAAIGEPLLHPEIADMTAYARDAGIAESIDIVTNASRLTPAVSDALIEAGLSRLRISLEGLSSEDYRRNAGVTVDFRMLTENIRYFYRHKNETHVYIKIIDYMTPSIEQEARFHEIFEPICDSLSVEHLTPTVRAIDYRKLAPDAGQGRPQNGDVLLDARICPQGFYMMQINPDGKVAPCCNMTYPAILGDANEQSVPEIWNGGRFDRFRNAMLESRDRASPICGECLLYRYDLHDEDRLDEAAVRLREVYGAAGGI
jgi:radical SAM protein with 4Fe4S-binding SPASM domain